jgi:hypothetical protein
MRERGFDALVLRQGSGRPELEAVVGEVVALVAESGSGLESPATLVYGLAYS